jgi:hypothetical protein
MGSENDKIKSSTRRQRDENAVNKQVKIARQRGRFSDDHMMVKQPHRLAKHHALDCGNPRCYLCGNPRKLHKDKLTAQEKRLFQDTEYPRDRKSNGIIEDEE